MKDPVEWRIELADDIGKRICAVNGIQAIVAGGSAARGCADQNSDLDLYIFWDKMPEDNTRQEIAAELRADFFFSHLESDGADRIMIQGFPVDLCHNTLACAEQMIQRVLKEYNPTLEYSAFMEMLRTCVCLYGKERIRNWKNKAALFPDDLAIRYIQNSIGRFTNPEMELMQARSNPSLGYTYLVEQQQNVFLTLLGLNRRYFPSFKWMYHALENMDIKPPEIEDRFRAMFKNGIEESTNEMIALIGETLSLVEYTYPQVDLASTKIRMALVRETWEQPLYL